jgi:hypothetical protein
VSPTSPLNSPTFFSVFTSVVYDKTMFFSVGGGGSLCIVPNQSERDDVERKYWTIYYKKRPWTMNVNDVMGRCVNHSEASKSVGGHWCFEVMKLSKLLTFRYKYCAPVSRIIFPLQEILDNRRSSARGSQELRGPFLKDPRAQRIFPFFIWQLSL